MKRELVILGSTGSIGVQALEIVAANPDRFSVIALSAAGSNPDLLIEQAKKFKVKSVGVADNSEKVRDALPGVEVIDGARAASEIAAITCDVVLNAITGSIGLDDWEWGVDLFADDPLVFKRLIYEMRFDEVSAKYAKFGQFYVGVHMPAEHLEEVLIG